MASVPTIDIGAILKPISGETPAGSDVRETKSFEILKEARREEEPLSQGDWKRELKIADWPKVIHTATKILTTESKDLQVAAWLVEGLVKQHGFAGLRDGFKILRGLHESFWDSMFPGIEDGDLEFRSGRLEALDKILPGAIKSVVMVHPPGGPAYHYWHYKQSQEVENLRRGAATDAEMRRQFTEALEEGKLEGDKFDKAVAATPLTHCTAILESLSQSWEECQTLERAIEEKYGQDAPGLQKVKAALGDCRSMMDGIVKKKGGVGFHAGAPAAAPQETTMGQAVPATPLVNLGEPSDRAEALRQLARVAEFFRRTEPHSPVSYLVQRAVRWGEMPLEEWLNEVIKNEGVLGEVKETLGLTHAPSSATTES